MNENFSVTKNAMAQIAQALYNIIDEAQKGRVDVLEIIQVNAENALLWLGDSEEEAR